MRSSPTEVARDVAAADIAAAAADQVRRRAGRCAAAPTNGGATWSLRQLAIGRRLALVSPPVAEHIARDGAAADDRRRSAVGRRAGVFGEPQERRGQRRDSTPTPTAQRRGSPAASSRPASTAATPRRCYARGGIRRRRSRAVAAAKHRIQPALAQRQSAGGATFRRSPAGEKRRARSLPRPRRRTQRRSPRRQTGRRC